MNKRSKKLELSREHLRALSGVQLTQAAGGAVTLGYGFCDGLPSREPCSMGSGCGNSGNNKCY